MFLTTSNSVKFSKNEVQRRPQAPNTFRSVQRAVQGTFRGV